MTDKHPVCEPLCAPDCEERINCPDAGTGGHWSCGWCDVHNKPIHRCPHFHPDVQFG